MTIQIRPANSRPHEPRAQFSLRALLVVVTGLCAVFALFSYSGREWFPVLCAIVLLGGAFVTMIWAYYHGSGEMFFAGLALLLGMCILPPLFQQPRVNTRSGQCRNNLRQIAVALQNYEATTGTLPPAYFADENGKPMHSWRVMLLPYMEQNYLYSQYRFDEPWNGPNNSKLADAIGRTYRCPSESFGSPAALETSYVAVVGPQTVWSGSGDRAAAGIPDGSTWTLQIVEVKNSGIHWMEPRDLDFSAMPFQVNAPTPGGPGSNHKGYCRAVWCDGSVQTLPNNTPPKILRALLTKSGGEDVSSWRNK